MAGTWDNERQEYLLEDSEIAGDWWVDAEGRLYVVPVGDGDLLGLDGEPLDALTACYRDHEGDECEAAAEAMGFERVPWSLKRYSTEDGYYIA